MSKWQFVFRGRERDGYGPHTAGPGGDAELDHHLGESHAVAGTGSPATVITSVQSASFPATKARIWALVAVPRSGHRGANSALYRIALVRMSRDARANEFAPAADRSDFPAGGCRPVIGRVQLLGEREDVAIMGGMPSSPHHPSPASKNLSGTDAEDLALYREKFHCRLPESLDELHGPTQRVVELPLHIAWSGSGFPTRSRVDRP